MDCAFPRIGIAAVGKSYVDVLKALEDLGIGTAEAAQIGLRLYKVAVPWPLEQEGVLRFARGLEEIIVVEEKRALVESQLKELLYPLPEDARPRIIGKDIGPDAPGFDRKLLLSDKLDFTPAEIALLLAERLGRVHASERMRQRVARIEERLAAARRDSVDLQAPAVVLLGLPAQQLDQSARGQLCAVGDRLPLDGELDHPDTTRTTVQMGGEGVTWMGLAPFTDHPHIFANLGDGTYFHSGLMAIRQAVASKLNITYKILYNDAVAMTGGQPVDGPLSGAAADRPAPRGGRREHRAGD